jgi:hypothetical protein
MSEMPAAEWVMEYVPQMKPRVPPAKLPKPWSTFPMEFKIPANKLVIAERRELITPKAEARMLWNTPMKAAKMFQIDWTTLCTRDVSEDTIPDIVVVALERELVQASASYPSTYI